MRSKRNVDILKQYLPYFYLILSLYIFIQTTFFPKAIADILIDIVNPKLDSGNTAFLIQDYVRYLTIVVYSGLAISSAFFFTALDILILKWIKSIKTYSFIHLFVVFLNFSIGFLCGVKVYHLLRGKNPGFFAISGQTTVTLIVLLICILTYTVRKEKRRNSNHIDVAPQS